MSWEIPQPVFWGKTNPRSHSPHRSGSWQRAARRAPRRARLCSLAGRALPVCPCKTERVWMFLLPSDIYSYHFEHAAALGRYKKIFWSLNGLWINHFDIEQNQGSAIWCYPHNRTGLSSQQNCTVWTQQHWRTSHRILFQCTAFCLLHDKNLYCWRCQMILRTDAVLHIQCFNHFGVVALFYFS